LKQKKQSTIFLISLIISSICSISLFIYVLRNSFEEIQIQSKFLFILIITYIIMEILKKNYLKFHFKWNKMYYLGLISFILPKMLIEKLPIDQLKLIYYGLIFMILPILLELNYYFKNHQK
jgi:uncharacterized membrane protein HdeD (DUF308 family)